MKTIMIGGPTDANCIDKRTNFSRKREICVRAIRAGDIVGSLVAIIASCSGKITRMIDEGTHNSREVPGL